MLSVPITVKRLLPEARIPTKATAFSSGYDLYALEDVCIPAGDSRVVGTGLAVQIPEGFEIQIRPRSSLGKNGITIPNSPGTVDADFRGEIGVILANNTSNHYYIKKHDRIAQMVLQAVPESYIMESQLLTETTRGSGGFGSTGK